MTPSIPRGKSEIHAAEPAASPPQSTPGVLEAPEEMACFQPGAGLAFGMGTELGLDQAYSVRLFGPACLPVGHTPSYTPEMATQEPIGISQRPVPFDSGDDFQKCVAQNLQGFLSELNLDEINQKIHGNLYGVFPVYDTGINLDQIQHTIKTLPGVSPAQKLAVGFFMYGQALNPQEMEVLFGENRELWNQLQELQVLVSEPSNQGVQYRLNHLTLVTHQLPNKEVLYLLADLPTRLQDHGEVHPTAQISGTSYIMLHRLQKTFQEGDMDSPQGVIADFGSGIGILALAMLKMYPNIDTALGVEIDEHSMNLSRFNAMLNGVEDRYQVVDNHDEANFMEALGNRPLDMAISNPPFNVVPTSLAEEFTDFGDGGAQGLDITKIFLDQAMPVLRDGGRFVAYSVLAQDSTGEYLLTRHLRDAGFGNLTLNFEGIHLPRETFTRKSYAKALAGFLEAHGGIKNAPEQVGHIDEELAMARVARLVPTFWTLQMGGVRESLSVSKSQISLPVLEARYGKPQAMVYRPLGGESIKRIRRPGGVFETSKTLGGLGGREARGGVYVTTQRVRNLDPVDLAKLFSESLREYCRGNKANTAECQDLEAALEDPKKLTK